MWDVQNVPGAFLTDVRLFTQREIGRKYLMLINTTRAAVLALVMAMPVAMQAQRGMGAGGGRGGGNPVAPLIDMRRELNLSARQLTQLDSIERTLLQRNQGLRERMRTRLDSMRPRNREASEAEIARLRAEGDSMRALRQVIVRNDSVARAAALSVLTDSQRVRVSERLAERRGFAAGRMSAMRGGQRGFRGRPGMQGPGPRMRQRGPGGGMGGMGMRQGEPGGRMGGMGLRRPGGMRGPDGVGPRFDNRRPTPGDSMAPMRRFRGPPADSALRGDSAAPARRFPVGAPRLRRPPVENGR